jgi:O-antigen/teichoic acid export membrane protein
VTSGSATTPADDAAETNLPKSGEVLSGGLWTSMSRFVPQMYTLVVSVVAARFLGPAGMGRQSFIAFVELTAIFAFTAGVPLTLGRFVAANLGAPEPAHVRSLVRWAWRTESIGAALAIALFVAIAATGADPQGAWLLAGIAASLGILYAVPSTLLMATRRWRQAALVTLATGFLGTAATVIVLAAGGRIVAMFAVEAAVAATSFAITGVLARRALAGIERVEDERPPMRAVRTFTLWASLTAVLDFVVWRRSEFFVLNHFSSDTQIALYSIPFAAVTALVRLPEPISRVVTPTVATLTGAGAREKIATGFGRGFRLLVFGSIPLTAVALALGPRTLTLVYGSDYSDAGRVLLILLAPFPLLPLLGLATAVMLGLGRQVVNAVTMAVATALDIGLDFLLIPAHGAVGAAIANACAQTAGALPMIVYALVTFRGAQLPMRFFVKVAALGVGTGAAALAGVALFGGAAGLLLGIALAVVSFTVLGRLLRVLIEADGRWLAEVGATSLGGWIARASRAWAELPGT